MDRRCEVVKERPCRESFQTEDTSWQHLTTSTVYTVQIEPNFIIPGVYKDINLNWSNAWVGKDVMSLCDRQIIFTLYYYTFFSLLLHFFFN